MKAATCIVTASAIIALFLLDGATAFMAAKNPLPPTHLFSSFPSDQFDWTSVPPSTRKQQQPLWSDNDATEDMLSQRMEREDNANGMVERLATATGSVLLAALMFVTHVWGPPPATDLIAVPTTTPPPPKLATVVQTSTTTTTIVQEQQAAAAVVPFRQAEEKPEAAAVAPPQLTEEEAQMDFLIDQSAGFFFY